MARIHALPAATRRVSVKYTVIARYRGPERDDWERATVTVRGSTVGGRLATALRQARALFPNADEWEVKPEEDMTRGR